MSSLPALRVQIIIIITDPPGMASADFRDPADAGGSSKLKRTLHEMLSSSSFDAAMGAVIILNAVVIGLESQSELKGVNTDFYAVFEHAFLFIYSVELGCRFYLYGLACLRNGWVVFDSVLVTFGALATYIIEPLLLRSMSGSTGLS